MASKNIHAGDSPDQALLDLGFEDAKQIGLVVSSIETLIISESKSQYDKILDLLETETTSDLTTVKKLLYYQCIMYQLID